jgi:RpiB/LacA/LacB family sugar-phosphate isomerase
VVITTFTPVVEAAIVPHLRTVKIHLASDHAGVKLRLELAERLRRQGHEVVDIGAATDAPSDYPDWAGRVGRAVRAEKDGRGVLVCGSGFGAGIAVNKLRGIRAAVPWTVEGARLSRAHNDCNVLCLGARLLAGQDVGEILEILDAFLTTPFEGGRHAVRVGKIAALESDEAFRALVEEEAARLTARKVVERLWAGDPRAFTPDTAHDKSIRNRLGWLRSPDESAASLGELGALAAQVRQAGLRQAVLLGMGGSSLCPEVLAHTFGGQPGIEGIPLTVLDSTDPEAVAAVLRAVDLTRTLFVVSSKSGGTIEVRSFERFFWDKTGKAGSQFVAITDPGTELDRMATEKGYRAVLRNPPDIGGRYSALSLFGLLPAALLGIDVGQLLERARRMAAACRAPSVLGNPGAELGGAMAAAARAGRDKLTLLAAPEIASLGSWIEQLVAESTGKLGKGILPVDGEPLGPPAAYGPDRLFVTMRLASGAPAASEETITALRAAGHPVVELVLPDRYDLGAEFFRWEVATAVAGAALVENPFDEPNVTEAKQATAKLLESFARDRKLPGAPAVAPDDRAAILAHLDRAGPGQYLALCAFFLRTDGRHELLERLRLDCRDRLRVATTLGYGPRFLHSTGQLHKGGPATGVFLQLVTEGRPESDLPVPGDPFTFGVLRDAQALGDFQVLQAHGLPALRVQLGPDVEAGLARLLSALRG